MQGNTSVNQSTVGTNGVTSINNIVVTGTQGEAATDGTVCSKVKASVEPGDVEAGTKVELSCATEGATITYHTDLDSADKTYTEALVIEEDVTIYATAELEGYETSETAEFAYTVKQGAKSKEAALATTLSDGNIVALYYENNGTGSVLSQTASGKKLKGVSATAADGALAIPEDTAELTVSVDENGYYTFVSGDKYLTSGATGSSVTFADAAGDYSLWKLQKANENGGYYVINANAKYNNTTEQYLEYYNGFTTYSYKSSSDAAYVFYFYLIDEGTPSVHIRADESVTENVAQWSGTADYKTAGVTADPRFTRITIVTSGDDDILEQIEKQVGKLVDVRDIKELDPEDSVYRELVLVKVKVDPEKRLEIRQGVEFLANNFRAKIIDVGAENLIVEFTGNHSKVNALIQRFNEEYEVLELARTGITGLGRGIENVTYIED